MIYCRKLFAIYCLTFFQVATLFLDNERQNVYMRSLKNLSGSTLCKDGWLPFKGSCYWFGKDTFAFTEAEHYCRQHNAHLVHINDATENAFIKDKLRSLKSNNWWLGITDEAIESIWNWYDTDTQAEYLDFWPSDHAHTGEDCAILFASYDFKWADAPCNTYTALPLCEVASHGCDDNPIIG